MILNKSSAWGTEPWPWYFSNCLPRALFLSLLLVPVGLVKERGSLRLAFPAIVFVALYSFLPHKETRFVIYAFPMLNVCAAAACDRIWRQARSSASGSGIWNKILALGVAAHLICNLAYSGAALTLSSTNYPGGDAMAALHDLAAETPQQALVHLDNLACQTGASRFTQLRDDWVYDKTEGIPLKSRLASDSGYTHLVTELPADEDVESKDLLASSWSVLATINKSAGLAIDLKSFPPIFVRTEPALLVLERLPI